MIKKAVGKLLPAKLKTRLKDAAEVLRYTAPDPLRPSVPLSAKGEGWLKTLRRDGIVEIRDERTIALARHIEEKYSRAVEKAGMPARLGPETLGPGLFAERKHQPNMDSVLVAGTGREDQYLLSLQDPPVAELFLDPDVAGLCYDYFRRQPYYRNQPVLDIVDLKPEAATPEDISPIHVDHIRQMSGMLLLNDLGPQSTHMEYYMGSHKRSLLKDGVYMTREQCKAWAAKHADKLRHLTGPAGTLFIFDATAIHRRALHAGSVRRMFHWNITPGHNLQPFKEDLTGWAALAAAPDYVQAAFKGAR